MQSQVQLNLSKQEYHNEKEQFESISGNSSDIEEQVRQVQKDHPKNYTFNTIRFPELDSKTVRLFSIYEQNKSLINNLKQQIARLEHIKKQSVDLRQQLPKAAVDAPISQFFLTCQETYEKRQLQLLKLKKEIKTIDTEQVRILMAKNPNVLNLAEAYFREFKTIIDAKNYEEGLVLLTEQRKRSKKRKQDSLEEQMGKIKLDNVQHSTKTSEIKSRKQQKPRKKYMVRFVHYSEIFSELGNKNSPLVEKIHYVVPLSGDQVPISLVYSHKLRLVLILLKRGSILAFSLSQHDSSSSVQDNKSSHKTEQMYQKLTDIPGVRIEFDSKVHVVHWEIKENKLFVLTSDSLLRVYEAVVKEGNLETFKLSNIIYCQNRDIEIGQIVGMSFSPLNPQHLLFITDKTHLCMLDINKLNSELLYTYSEKLISVNSFYLQTSDKFFFSTQNFDPIETKLIDQSKIIAGSQQLEGFEQKEPKIVCLLMGQKIYLIKVETHGLLTGVELNLDSMSPQVEIIESTIQ